MTASNPHIARAAEPMVVTRVGDIACALPIAHVIETMRPLPIEPVGHAVAGLSCLLGLAVVRGSPIPVLDVARLLGHAAHAPTRFVIVRTNLDDTWARDDKRIALLVDAVLAVKAFERAALAQLPPLLRDASREVVTAIGSLDESLLLVLHAGRAIPADTWRALERETA
jgi:purine-binding chemotaxis protein CheW